jgi:dTDP-4-dehydrorhamnose 3,5-epimerase
MAIIYSRFWRITNSALVSIKMTFQPTLIDNCWIYVPRRFEDSRGYFQETFKVSQIEQELGFTFEINQVNQSRSAKGVLRGIHWADVPPGQRKYVSVARGQILDFVVDLRVDSPTFKKWQMFNLSEANGHVLLIGNGIGHAFLSLEDETVVTYFCDQEYSPSTERTLNPLDGNIGIPFEQIALDQSLGEVCLSPKDQAGLDLMSLLEAGILPKVL